MENTTANFYLGYEHTIRRQSPYADSNRYDYLEGICLLNSKYGEQQTIINEYESGCAGYSTSQTVDSYEEYVVVPCDQTKIACVAIVGHNYTGSSQNCKLYEFTNREKKLMWYFPGKPKWVVLGKKRSYELLQQHGGTIPQWLEDAVCNEL